MSSSTRDRGLRSESGVLISLTPSIGVSNRRSIPSHGRLDNDVTRILSRVCFFSLYRATFPESVNPHLSCVLYPVPILLSLLVRALSLPVEQERIVPTGRPGSSAGVTLP